MKLKTAVLLAAMVMIAFISAGGQQDQKRLDPAAWGENHAGKPIPEYLTGDECLFCHRNDIGPTWPKNAHGKTVRPREVDAGMAEALEKEPSLKAVASEVEYFLGSRNHVRLLKKAGYGKFALLNARAMLGSDGHIQKWSDAEKPVWDKERFADRCAGCHTTAVDAAAKTFRAFGLDCYTCHGNVTLDHTENTSLVWLSKKRRRDAKAITSICAQCHIRNGKSRSTGLPYPNNFIAGDNLFQDFEVDFSKADDRDLNAGDRHILRNVRDVALSGSDYPTCITCHDVHGPSSVKHRRAPRTQICADCHNAEGSLKEIKRYSVKSPLCEY
ncbi:MAG: hypothetical protein L0229_17400 [Blastocatellia bacterium]|nr:hypothetical protein [Blastocatellia bacterium]